MCKAQCKACVRWFPFRRCKRKANSTGYCRLHAKIRGLSHGVIRKVIVATPQ